MTASETKRTPLRISQEKYNEVAEYAKNKNLSLNSAFLDLIDKGLVASSDVSFPNIKIIHLNNGYRRVIYGKLLNSFDIDFSQDLTSLKLDIETSLETFKNTKFSFKITSKLKDIKIHQGANHLDIINNNVGSLGWLIVEDHWTSKASR